MMPNSQASPAGRRRERTRRRILQAARGCVGQGGIDALTLSAVAQVLDLTTPALYRYFPNKGALLAAVNAEVLAEQREVVRRLGLGALYEGRIDPLVALLGVVEATILLAERQPDDFALLVATLADPRTLVDDLAHAVHMPELFGLQAEIVGWFQRAAADGALGEGSADERALSLTFAVLGALQTRKLARFRPQLDPVSLARNTARALFLGWGADPERLAPRAVEALRAARRARLEVPA